MVIGGLQARSLFLRYTAWRLTTIALGLTYYAVISGLKAMNVEAVLWAVAINCCRDGVGGTLMDEMFFKMLSDCERRARPSGERYG